MKYPVLSSLCLGLATLSPAADQPASAKQQALATFAAQQNSVIIVSASVAMNMGGGPPIPPQDMEVIGTIVTVDGQVAVSLSTMDPLAQIPGMAAGPPSAGPPPPPYKGPLAPPPARATPPEAPKSAITNIKLFYPGGETVAGKVVLRDPKTDVLLLQPVEAPKQKITPVMLENAPQPALLDDLILISRLSLVLDRTPALTLTTVDAVIAKPEPAWHAAPLPSVGGPVFTLDGRFVGLALNRVLPAELNPVMTGEEMTPPVEPVIIPAAAIQKALLGKRESDLIVPLPPKPKAGTPPKSEEKKP